MGIINEREEALEKEYIMKLERSFHIQARRDRMLARWAAELIGRNDFDVILTKSFPPGCWSPATRMSSERFLTTCNMQMSRSMLTRFARK
ncbi:DUF1476 family protein [Rhizobium lentis]|uniref:DUF1476 family protein n=1 Tax=Rhizobium lentis TaxID=1138194 RepID=A0A9Q3QWX2_9HYPH|nr:ATPase inhibitor subunit zeta [Rhizobium lentis]MBX4988173.1 DUF1476 family protein [Rhizobium lentis]MBX5006622.1 DUF1476 family protein [Rhizobium lentis]MBX5013058.1 DUF1476 family protein [Rhizobium lentis]MBX5025746.1 DUF1476 family protein [Rhizobium lentis]MBX5031219.1 DUF1476 family protein [Rhizobium lentis]